MVPTLEEGAVHPGDCRDLIPLLPKESVTLILTDPPYFLHGLDSHWSHQDLADKAARSSGKVRGLPAGMKFDPKQGQNLQAFLEPVASQLLDVCQPGAYVLCFSAPRLAHRAAAAWEDSGFEIMDLLAWNRPAQPRAMSAESLLNRSSTRFTPEERKAALQKMQGLTAPQLTPQYEAIVWARKPGPERNSKNVELDQMLRFPRDSRQFGHLTVKPVALLRTLIAALGGPPGSLVLDPFAGSGSTGVAAHSEGYKFIGMELDPEMAALATERIKTAPVQPALRRVP